jgi:hypothetical protein
MTEFVGNCNNIIDWESIVSSLILQPPSYIGPRHSETDDIIGISNISKSWNDAGYVLTSNGGSAGWGMYFAGDNFDKSIIEIFSNFVGINPINAWISCINPGQMAPWHWDANDYEEEYSKMLNMLRFSCHISKPSPGHVFIVDDLCLYNQRQGDTWKWSSRQSWHAGANCGIVPKFMFNIFGIKK